MKIHTDLASLPDISNAVVTIGTFDGVHPGHLSIISRVKQLASEVQGESVLLTFYPHPRMVLHPGDHNLELLNTPAEKARLLEKTGIDHLVIYPFSLEFSRLSPLEYVRELLVNGLHSHTVVVGYDHRFGRNREGDQATLLELSEVYGFNVEEIPARAIDEVNISSTKIRQALRAGNVSEAARYLGRQYSVEGKVIHGDKVGRELGFPTANLDIAYPSKLIPAHGVYAVYVETGNRKLPGVMNIGVRPTTHTESAETIEVYIMDFAEDLYDKQIIVNFVERMRDEKKFGSIDELKECIGNDVMLAREML